MPDCLRQTGRKQSLDMRYNTASLPWARRKGGNVSKQVEGLNNSNFSSCAL